MVSFRGDRIAQRGDDGSAPGAGAVSWVRDGGDRLVAGAGVRRCGGGPRRASPNAKAAGRAAAQQRRDSISPAAYGENPPSVQRCLGDPEPMPGARPSGTAHAPKRAVKP